MESLSMNVAVRAAARRWAIGLAAAVLLGASGPAVAAPKAVTTETGPSADAAGATDASTSTTDDPATATTPTDPADDGVVPRAPNRKVSYAAQLVAPTVVRKRPANRAKGIKKLQPYGSWNGGPVVLSIAQVKVIDGVRWLRVRLPIRPNNSTGWVPEANVAVSKLRYRVEVSRAKHTVTLLRDGKKIASSRVVVGAPATPTPAGTFAVLEVVRQPKGSILGPFALHLTAHSDVLDNYGGGPGRVALHGRSGGLLNDPLGTSRSHGCIRMPNSFVRKLAKVAVEGTPVTIR
ncbi:MAG: L,D-transpeptidase [Solirubrobacteraceae bacterium]|nr:L,D-transpeptidase [Solirubrobacteraceae bacterium]